MKNTLIFACVTAVGLALGGTGCGNRAKQQAEVKRLQTELQNVKAALEKAKNDAMDIEARMEIVTQARDDLQKQVNELTAARDHLQQTLTQVGASRDQSRQRLAEVTSSRDQLQTQFEQITAVRNILREELATAAKARDAAIAEARKAQQQIEVLTSQLQAEVKKTQALQDQLVSPNQTGAGAEATQDQTIASPIIQSFATTRPKINAGQNSTLSWRVSNAKHIRIEPDIGPVGVLGSRTIAPSKTTTYTLIAINEAGESRVTRRIEVF
jgi:DNA repair exonuclease SbcCD ATPase subunit